MAACSGAELEQAVHQALRHWANPTSEEREPAAHEFLALYQKLQQDTELPITIRTQLLSKLRYRLANLARRLSRQLAAKEPTTPERPQSVDRPGRENYLAQRNRQASNGNWPGSFALPRGPQPRDAGEELVDLIQRTIAPRSWARLGGPGTIYYWRPGHAIVARAPEYVHEQISDLLQQMNPQGR